MNISCTKKNCTQLSVCGGLKFIASFLDHQQKMDPLRVMFFVMAWIALCSYGTYADTLWKDFTLIGERVPHDKEVGSFTHKAEVRLVRLAKMKHRYTFDDVNCAFSQIAIQNLATPTYGGHFFIREGGIGSSQILLEEWGSVNREYHANIKLFGYHKLNRNEKCTAHEIVI